MNFIKLRDVKSPQRGTPGSAGIDFFVPNDFPGEQFLTPHEAINIPSGIKVKVPKGYALVFMNKSGVSLKKGLQVGACVIDEDYQGEVHLHLINTSAEVQSIMPGEKLVQGLLLPVSLEDVIEMKDEEELYNGEKTERGEGGFGSTGTK